MARIYLSSTYSDLKDYRAAAYEALRKLRHDVIAMEDYVATDQRPLDVCLSDIAGCDIYIGLFAWRYGYIPVTDNPTHKSITELEYRKAVDLGIPRLLFLLDEDAAWPPKLMDRITGENERGDTIGLLRQELQQRELVSFFKSPEQLSNVVGQAIYLLEKRRLAQNDVSLALLNNARVRYLEHVYNRYGSVRLPIGPAEGFSLQAIFQPLMLRRDPSTAEDEELKLRNFLLNKGNKNVILVRPEFVEPPMQEQTEKAVTTVAENGDDALSKSPQRRVVVLGGPGTGKTITLKYLVGDRAKQALNDPDASLPIFLSLPGLARSGKTLQRYLVDIVEDMGAESRYADVLWKEIEAGRAFICLDSLDEAPPQSRVEMIELINTWTYRPGNTWIIGSRFTEYKGGQFKQGQFYEWELLPLNHSLRLGLAKRLLPELQLLLPSLHESILAPETFVDMLEQHPNAATWGENPLLFSLAAVVVLQTGGMPTGRARLYHNVIEAVLKTREQDQFWCNLLLRILTSFALWLHQEKGRTFTSDDLLSFFTEIQGKSWAEAAEMTRRVISSGVMEIVARDTYAFRHQTFQEYLAAAELAHCLTSRDARIRQEAWNLAWGKRTYSRWVEILRLMVGVLALSKEQRGRDEAQRWLRALIQQHASQEGDPGNLGLILALKSLTEVTEVADWENASTTALENNIITMWLYELREASVHERLTTKEYLIRLANDVGHLRKPSLEKVSKQLLAASTEEKNRDTAEKVLQNLGDRLPLDLLLQALHSKNDQVRATSLKVLGKQGEHVSLDVFITALQDKANDVHEAAIAALIAQGKRVPIELLLSLLQDGTPEERAGAAKVLAKQGERIPVEVLLQGLSSQLEGLENAEYEKNILMNMLATQGERIPVDMLVSALQNAPSEMRSSIIKALSKHGKDAPSQMLISALQDGDLDVCLAALRALGALGEELPVEALFPALENYYDLVSVTALQIVGARAPLNPLVALLRHRSRSVREEAVHVLRGRDEPIPVAMLKPALQHPDEQIRADALQVLGFQKEPVAIEKLIEALQDKSWLVRSSAVRALGSQGEHAPLELLLSALQDSSGFVQEEAVLALGSQGERAPIDILISTLQDKDKFMRRAAAQALIGQGERVPLEVLITALEDEDREVRRAINQVLREINPEALRAVDPEALKPLLRHPIGMVLYAIVQGFALDAPDDLGRSLRYLLETLTRLLDWPDVQVQLTAIRILAKIRRNIPDATIQRLLIMRGDTNRRIRTTADDALAEILSLETGIEDD